jgi:hypothetical protein
MYYLILAVLTIIVLIVATKSAMLRNQVFNESNFLALASSEGISNPKPAFSLGRSQLAFWTVIIVSSFIYVYLDASPQTYSAPVLAEVNLILLGIAAGTTVASTVIDGSQKDAQNGGIPQQDYPSQGFLRDIISDENGVSIHRLQNVIWTIIIAVIYIAYVAAKSKMPDDQVITNQLLILMGISSGAYLGLKTTENQAPAANTPANAAPVTPSSVTPAAAVPIPTAPASTAVNLATANPVTPTSPVAPSTVINPATGAAVPTNTPPETPPVQ